MHDQTHACRGKAVNQLEAPLTEAKSTEHCKDSSKFLRKAEDREENSSVFRLPVKLEAFYAVEQKAPQQREERNGQK